MSEHAPTATERVQAALSNHGLESDVVTLAESTRTAVEAAQAIGCRVEQIAKSIIFRSRESGNPILVIASGVNRVDETKIAEFVGEPIRKADADFVRTRIGFVIGGVPPIGHVEPIRTFIDEDLNQFDRIWAAAGTPHAVFSLTPEELLRISNGVCVRVKS